MSILYKKRRSYKYKLAQACVIQTSVYPAHDIETAFISLNRTGVLQLKANYAWDGASGPMPDLRSIMRASLAHDACYQLMREGHLSPQAHRQAADQTLLAICLADGMNQWLAYWVYFCVRQFGFKFAQTDLYEIKTTEHTGLGIAINQLTELAPSEIPLDK